MESLKLTDYSDRELLFLIQDVADKDGWVTTEGLAAALDLNHPNPIQCVGTRMGWMARFGIVEKGRAHTWRLSHVGYAVMRAGLNKGAVNAMGSTKDEALLELTHKLTDRYASTAPEVATLMRREWRWGMAR